MSKMKVHELAKKIGISSKEAVERAKELGIDIKNHLSILEENDVKKLEESFEKQKKDSSGKNSAPVIIRRQVIMENEEEKVDKNKNIQPSKKGVGFVENERKKDYNIVYRNKQVKPLTVSELFGMPKKDEPKTEVKEKNIEKPEEKET